VSAPPPSWAPTGASSPIDDKRDIEVIDSDPDRLVASMPVEGNQQPFGLLHGGVTCALMETIGSWAAVLSAGPTARRSASSGTTATSAQPPLGRGQGGLQSPCGGTLAAFLIEVSYDQGRPTASGWLSCMILPA
jgi:1,4-dihydroxy-2-naphthoyl-CoA hydrolase